MAKNKLEEISDLLADEMLRIDREIPQAPRPFGAKRLSRKEQYQRYLEMRDDNKAWLDIIQERGVRAAMDYWREMEKIGDGMETDEQDEQDGE